MCFVLACCFVMTTGAAIDRHFENLHSSSLEPIFLKKSWTFKLKLPSFVLLVFLALVF